MFLSEKVAQFQFRRDLQIRGETYKEIIDIDVKKETKIEMETQINQSMNKFSQKFKLKRA